MKDNVGKSLSTTFTEMQKTYGNMIDAIERKIWEDLVNVWQKIGTYFQVESARLAASPAD